VRGAHVLDQHQVTISVSNSSPLRFLIAATDRSRRQRTRQAPIWRARRLRQTRARPEGLCFWSKSTSLQVSKSSRETFGEFYVQLKTAMKASETFRSFHKTSGTCGILRNAFRAVALLYSPCHRRAIMP